MGGVLEERYGVSMSGVSWDAGNFKLWGAQSPGVILFSVKQPMIARSLTTQRYEAAVTQYRAQKDGTNKIIGGGAAFTLTTAPEFTEAELETLKEQWRQTLAGQTDAPADPVFVPLNTRKGTTEFAIPEIAGKPSALTAKANDAGTPGGTLTYMAELTDVGAQEWADAIRTQRAPIGQVMLQYEYLRYMPNCAVEIVIHGDRVFNHFSGELKASYDGWLYGGSVDIQAQFESLRADGSIEMKFYGLDDLPAGMEKIKENVIGTVVDQGLKAMLGMLFQPKPDVKPAEAGDSGGFFGGANLALKWRHEEEAVDLNTKLEFGGFTWLTERADPDLSMFAVLDDSYVTTVNTELQFPASVTVVGDPYVASTAVSWSASGQAPQAPVFTAEGGTQTYVVTDAHPDDVAIDYTAKINYDVPSWPIVSLNGSGTVKDDLNNILIKPSAYLGSTTIYLYVKDAVSGGVQLVGTEGGDDYLVVNVKYSAPNLAQPIKASTRLTFDTPVTFSYPLDPKGTPGTATFSAFGVIGGKLVFAKEQPIGLDEAAVFVLVTDAGVQLVSGDALLGESDTTAKDLLDRRDTVRVTGDHGPDAATKKRTEDARPTASGTNGRIRGTLVAVEYDAKGAAVWVEAGGKRTRVPVLWDGLPSSFTEREQVEIAVGPQGEAEKILVKLAA
jgi:hypothetical protein